MSRGSRSSYASCLVLAPFPRRLLSPAPFIHLRMAQLAIPSSPKYNKAPMHCSLQFKIQKEGQPHKQKIYLSFEILRIKNRQYDKN
jgi:hypothetical protein